MSTSDRERRRIVANAAFTLIALVACASEPRQTEEPGVGGGSAAGGQGGDLGSGGEMVVPTGGSGAGRSGSGTSGGMTGAAGSETGGNAGRSSGNDSGEAGAVEIPEWPRPGDPCFVKDYTACPGPQAAYQLVCNGTSWEPGRTCGSEELCDRLTGVCSPITCDRDAGGFLACYSNNVGLVCGPDKVTVALRPCFRCVDMLGCVEPSNDEVYVDRPREFQASPGLWPDSLIPICVTNPAQWSPEELAAVRDVFYRGWARHTALRLTEFGTCTSESEGVALDLAEACDVELARIPRTGYPGPFATLPVTLCKSYLDSTGTLRSVSPELFEFAALHVFGHILGWGDRGYERGGSHAMMQGIEPARVQELSFGAGYGLPLQMDYGATPSGSLGGPTGRCLSIAPSGDASHETCDGSPARIFRSVGGRLEHLASGKCLRLTDGDRVGLGDCSSAEQWQADRVAWLTRGGYCMTLRQDARWPLVAEPCDPLRAAAQTFSFEFPAPGIVRIRLVKDGRCVRWPIDWRQRNTPELGVCDGVHDLFETRGGELGAAGRCLLLVYSTATLLEFSACDGGTLQRYGLSGPLESQTGALTAVPNGDTLELRTTPLSGTPSGEQIFDFYF